jgi:hypothetical protein
MSGHRDVWFLYHVPKTGEQTLRNHVRSRLDAEAHVHLGRWSATDPPVGRAIWAEALEDADRAAGLSAPVQVQPNHQRGYHGQQDDDLRQRKQRPLPACLAVKWFSGA